VLAYDLFHNLQRLKILSKEEEEKKGNGVVRNTASKV
jgi:hypothetical protein